MTLNNSHLDNKIQELLLSTEENVSPTKINAVQQLSYLFKTAIKSQQEILDWYYYSFEFESRVHTITLRARKLKTYIILREWNEIK